MSNSKLYSVACALLGLALVILAAPASAQSDRSATSIHLRRATFDPLHTVPSIASALQADTSSRLVLAQFFTQPTADLRSALAAAGATPLLYIPDNTLVLRLGAAGQAGLRSLPGLRWSGPFAAAYKLPADLDAAMSSQDTGSLQLRLLAAGGADVDRLASDIAALGGAVLDRSVGLNGVSLRVQIPANALREVVRRDDILWAERYAIPQVQNDKARAILGVTAVRQQLGWLNGAGQIVAVTDTGLDVQNNLSADFAGRVARAFTPWEVGAGSVDCVNTSAASTWSDRNGHGTHVTGTLLGSGANSPPGLSFAGVAPAASVVVQAVSTGGDQLDCLPSAQSFMGQAYQTGARVQNASWSEPSTPGAYSQFSSEVDDFLWQHKDHLFVVAAGNGGTDANRDGVIDSDSISQPATAKNVISVGATESDRPPTASGCSFSLAVPQNWCWSAYRSTIPPISNDFVSDNPDGIAAFSSRGPADDGRIKPEIVAPGTNIISSASQYPGVSYDTPYPGGLYAYDSGTSMSVPMISGMAALVRQWLAQSRQISTPSAALIKALLLNGATDISPGQYGTGTQREIPAEWPNNVEGWGRAALPDTLGLNGNQEVWLADNATGLASTGSAITYQLIVSGGAPLRLSLAWTDYPAAPNASKTLVNDLDLEVQTPDGVLVRGNATAALPVACRDVVSGADRCDNVESVAIAAPVAGIYTVRVRAANLPQAPQPFALVGRAQTITDRVLDPPVLQPIPSSDGSAAKLSWNAIQGATFYTVEQSATSDFAAITRTYAASDPGTAIVEDAGTYWFRVRACTLGGCGEPSNVRSATIVMPPHKLFYMFVSL